MGLQESGNAPIGINHAMALCNNIGRCYASLSQELKLKIWMESLLHLLVIEQQQRIINSTINPMNQQQQHDNKSKIMNIREDCFVLNTMSLILTDPFVAKAA